MMKPLIYLSGPITDNKTGRPRQGWEQEFLDAEQMLIKMGFDVINPVDIAKTAEDKWKSFRLIYNELSVEVPRWFYLQTCMEHLSGILMMSKNPSMRERAYLGELLGLYVIGSIQDISMSFGTLIEINYAMSAGLSVWSQYYNGYQMNNMLWQVTDRPTLVEIAPRLPQENSQHEQ